MGETGTPHFHDLEVFEHVPEPEKHLFFGDPRIPREKIETRNKIWKYYFYKSQSFGNTKLETC